MGLDVIWDIFLFRVFRFVTMSAADNFVTIINLLTKDDDAKKHNYHQNFN